MFLISIFFVTFAVSKCVLEEDKITEFVLTKNPGDMEDEFHVFCYNRNLITFGKHVGNILKIKCDPKTGQYYHKNESFSDASCTNRFKYNYPRLFLDYFLHLCLVLGFFIVPYYSFREIRTVLFLV